MTEEQAISLIKSTFEDHFNEENFRRFIVEIFKDNYQKIDKDFYGNYIPEVYREFVQSYKRLLKYEYNKERIDVLIVELKRGVSVERARSKQRNFIRDYLLGKFGSDSLKDAALVAFYSDDYEDWRFSFVKVEWKFDNEKNRIRDEATPAKRYSFLVGKNEKSHTAQGRFLPILENDNWKPTVKNLEETFNVEVVTEEFFKAYRFALNEIIIKSLSAFDIPNEKKYSFAQLLLSRIMFLYFLQRKGWFKWRDYVQDKNYVSNLWLKYKNWRMKERTENAFYSQWLCSLFFGAFNKKSQFFHTNLPMEIKESFSIMPFLNGGLFSKTELDELIFEIPDNVFEWLFEPDPNNIYKGFLETFNFTIDESLPIDVEVAVDPEMLGKVYESLIAEEEKGVSGIFYTPRIEIDYMCRMSLIKYLETETRLTQEKIIDFVFDPHNKVSELENEELSLIRKKLNDVKIVDPAVGSASFLVGMMNILLELNQEIAKVEKKEENIFALKQKIILENLYGVDVKDWAVMVGELRLWLSFVIDTDEKFMDIYTKPLLPNLSFKIRQGDSLIQEIADIQINLKSEMLNIPKIIREKINELVEKKFAFFSGLRSADLKELKEIEKYEQEIFKEIIQSKIDEMIKKIKIITMQIETLKSQKNLYDDEKTMKEIKQVRGLETLLQKEKVKLDKYLSLYNSIGNSNQKNYFLWELDFIEVFSQKAGFDIVIGNPPYVRQELIAPPLADKNSYSDDEWREIKREYKEKLIQSVKSVWGDTVKIDKKSDLYVYFYYQGLSLLRPGGIFCFINSNSWLDVGYGAGLQEFLLKNMKPLYVFDNLVKRSFKQADVNTVIVLIQRPENKPDDYTIKFVAFRKPFEDVSNAEFIKAIENINQPVFDNENFRIYPKTKKDLLLEGIEFPEEEETLINLEPEHLPYIGNKWGGKYLRAPEIYFKILEKGKGKLVRLGDIAEVRRGFTTGANEFFYLKPVRMSVKEVVEISEKNPDALIPVKNGAGWEGEIEAKFLKPVIKSLKDIKKAIVELDKIEFLVLKAKNPDITKSVKLKEYIEWGIRRKIHTKPTCKARNFYFELPDIAGEFLFNMSSGDRYLVPVNPHNFFIDARLYAIKVMIKQQYENFFVALNTTYLVMYWEIAGRVMTGSLPLLDLKVYELKDTLILHPKILDNKTCQEVFEKLTNREIYNIFTELGFDPSKPIREQEPNPMPDRKALDDIVFDALGLTEEERKEVYWSVAELVKTRLEKARSV
ncbi:MAG: BREX-1 system adenine-specific DNA-methyltransferase PglX [Ignavibacteria bacterium]|jgi:hypothetical protein|nr:BREX-1 system adenine-specific DNA-methyltransferase PglX [Ignavibacteria bacterium]MDH7528201.1 Eco57I restriction-modification methylase domain-containing protein [Ignavibacteria bacterium]